MKSLIIVGALALVGCGTSLHRTVRVENPYSSVVHQSDKGTFNSTSETIVDRRSGYEECKKELDHTLLPAVAPGGGQASNGQYAAVGLWIHEQCLAESGGGGISSGIGGIGGISSGIGGIGGIGGIPFSNGVVVPGAFAGYPANAPVYTLAPDTTSVVSGGVVVSSARADKKVDRKILLLGRAVEQLDCEVKRQKHQPCPKKGGEKK